MDEHPHLWEMTGIQKYDIPLLEKKTMKEGIFFLIQHRIDFSLQMKEADKPVKGLEEYLHFPMRDAFVR